MTLASDSVSPQRTEILVVGAGPAGAMAAYEMARAGHQVLLVDRGAFPRTKVCGCCMNARALELLARQGLRDHVEALLPHWYSTVRVTCDGRRADLTIPRGASLSRDKLDLALVDAAVAAGARFRDRTTASVVQPGTSGVPAEPRLPRTVAPLNHAGGEERPDLVQLSPEPQVWLTSDGYAPVLVSCGVLVVADGLGGAVARAIVAGERVTPASRIGVGTVVDDRPASACDDHCINMVVGNHGYVGMVRLEDERWNVAAALDPLAVKKARDVGAVINSLLNDAGLSSSSLLACASWRGTVPLSRCPTRIAAARTFLIGDAAGYVEPFTGDGIAAALESGVLVAPFVFRALAGWTPTVAAEWTRVLARHRARQRRVTSAVAWAVRRPAVARRVLCAVSRVPSLTAPVIEWLHQGRVIDKGAVT